MNSAARDGKCKAVALMHDHRLLDNEDFQLLEFAKEVSFEFGDESTAALPAEIEGGQNDDLVEINARLTLPNPSQREFTLLCRQASEMVHESPLDRVKRRVCKETPGFIGEREVDIVPTAALALLGTCFLAIGRQDQLERQFLAPEQLELAITDGIDRLLTETRNWPGGDERPPDFPPVGLRYADRVHGSEFSYAT